MVQSSFISLVSLIGVSQRGVSADSFVQQQESFLVFKKKKGSGIEIVVFTTHDIQWVTTQPVVKWGLGTST